MGDATGPGSGWYILGTIVAGGQFLKYKTLWEFCFGGIYAHPWGEPGSRHCVRSATWGHSREVDSEEGEVNP